MDRRTFFARLVGLAVSGTAWTLGRDAAPAAPKARRSSLSPSGPVAPNRDARSDLARWHAAARRPIVDSTSPHLRPLIAAVQANRPLRFRYYGGSDIGAEREVVPGLVFTADGFPGIYLSGYCHLRAAERTFLVERMTLADAA